MKIRPWLVLFFALALIFLPASNVFADETLKVGFITDLEYGKQKKLDHKRPKTAKTHLVNAINYFNTTFHPDIAVGGGDYINSYSIKSKEATKQMKTMISLFNRITGYKKFCIGNHDLRKLQKNKVQAILGMAEAHSVTDLNGFRIITLDTNPLVNGHYETTGRVSQEEMAWLEQQLNTSLPVLIFAHHNPATAPYRTDMDNATDLRVTLEKYPNVIAYFSGHTPINMQKEINGINYFIINNLSTHDALGSFATILATKSDSNLVNITIDQHGAKPVQYVISKQL